MPQDNPFDIDAYDDLFDEAGSQENLDPRWIKAHAIVESGLRPHEIGDNGRSLGLMQLQAPAADETGTEDRLETAQNIRGGERYLKRMMNQFGDPALASMAYNAGPNGNFNPEYLRRVFGE